MAELFRYELSCEASIEIRRKYCYEIDLDSFIGFGVSWTRVMRFRAGLRRPSEVLSQKFFRSSECVKATKTKNPCEHATNKNTCHKKAHCGMLEIGPVSQETPMNSVSFTCDTNCSFISRSPSYSAGSRLNQREQCWSRGWCQWVKLILTKHVSCRMCNHRAWPKYCKTRQVAIIQNGGPIETIM